MNLCESAPEALDLTDWALAAVSGAGGSLIGLVGLYLVYRLTRRDDRLKQSLVDAATEDRRELRYRLDTVVGLMEGMKSLAQDWSLTATTNLRDWERRAKRPITMEIEAFATRMIVDAPEFAKSLREETERMYAFPAVQAANVNDFADRADGLYEWILRWAADPDILDQKPTFF